MSTKFTLKTLRERIDRYLAGEKQDKPLLVWFDCPKDFELLADINVFSPLKLGDWYADVYDKSIVNNRGVGSILTDHDYMFDENGNTIKLTEEMRREFKYSSYLLKRDESGNPTTRIYIQSNDFGYIGKKGLTTVEYVKMFKEQFDMPSFLFLSNVYREKIEASSDLTGYEQVICIDEIESAEEFRTEFFNKAKKVYGNGRQMVDNFFLNYLEQAPLHHLSSLFDDEERYVMGVKLIKYKEATSKINFSIKRLFKPVIKDEGDFKNFISSLYTNGNISFEKLVEAVNELPEGYWNKWLDKQSFLTRILKNQDSIDIKSLNRETIISLLMLEGASFTMHNEVIEGIANFYNLK